MLAIDGETDVMKTSTTTVSGLLCHKIHPILVSVRARSSISVLSGVSLPRGDSQNTMSLSSSGCDKRCLFCGGSEVVGSESVTPVDMGDFFSSVQKATFTAENMAGKI